MSPHDTTVDVRRMRGTAAEELPQAGAGELPQAAAEAIPNGPAAAAILAAGIGACALGVFSLVGDAFKGAAHFFTFYLPTGPLSGVTTSAIIVWLVAWFALSRSWGGKTVPMGKVNAAAFVLLALGLLLTFPPFMDLLQGK